MRTTARPSQARPPMRAATPAATSPLSAAGAGGRVVAPRRTPSNLPMTDLDREAIRRRLEDVRERTLALVAPLDWPLLRRQHVPILSPMVWDLGHLGIFEETWLLRRVAGEGWLRPEYGRMFDPVVNPRPARAALPLPARGELFGYLSDVRERALVHLLAGSGDGAGPPADPGAAALLAGGYVWELIAEHEEQHQETLLQAMQAMAGPFYQPALRRPTPRPPAPPERDMVEVPAGPFVMGRAGGGFAYDNEREPHEVDLPAFRIDRFPVGNAEYLAFVEDGGYRRDGPWSEAGRRWRDETGAVAPLYWLAPGEPTPGEAETAPGTDESAWRLRRFGRVHPLDPEEPVTHVTYWEAEAYAAWAGKRLPTEAEWEKAALWDPDAGRARAWPWGDGPPDGTRANLDQLAFGPARAGAYPAGASACGAHQLLGDVWEWTASDFRAYPGFTAYPYAEYSEIFFDPDYKVLRGGSWATRPAVARGTFRNWDFPIRRQIFTGLRCAAGGAGR